MKPDLPPVSPFKFPPLNLDQPLESRLKLPDGSMVKEGYRDPDCFDIHCQSRFGRNWFSIRAECIEHLEARLGAISVRIKTLETLLKQGQPPESLLTAYDDIYEQLEMVYADGSLGALVMISKLYLVGAQFPPLATPGGGLKAAVMAAEFGYVSVYSFLGDYHLGEGRAYEAAEAYESGAYKGCSVCKYQLAQFAERGVGGQLKSVRAAFDLYAEATMGNYPPAWVAMARLWLRNPGEMPRPEHLVGMLKECVEMRCEGAATALAEIYLAHDHSSDTKRVVMSLYRCAAVGGDIEAQLKLASLLAGEGAREMEIKLDPEEALWWYERVYDSENASPDQAVLAHLKLGHLFMAKDQYDRAAHHFAFASDTYLEAAELHRICEKKGENLRRWRQHNTGGECL